MNQALTVGFVADLLAVAPAVLIGYFALRLVQFQWTVIRKARARISNEHRQSG